MTSFLTALRTEVSYPHHFLYIDVPGGPLRLYNGPGIEVLDSQEYHGEHATFGSVKGISNLRRSTGEIAKGWVIELSATSANIALARNPAFQGCRVKLWGAEIHPHLGVVNDNLLRTGVVNVAYIDHGYDGRVVVEISNSVDFLGDADETFRLSYEGQHAIDPTDEICEFMLASDQTLPWGGRNSARPVMSSVKGNSNAALGASGYSSPWYSQGYNSMAGVGG